MRIKDQVTVYIVEITHQELVDIRSCIKIANKESGFDTDEQAERCNNIFVTLEKY